MVTRSQSKAQAETLVKAPSKAHRFEKSTSKVPPSTPPKSTSTITLAPTTPPPPKSTGVEESKVSQPELDDDDDKTVNNDEVSVPENLKPIFQEAYKILNEKLVKTMPDSFNLFNANPEKCRELNKFVDKIQGKKAGTSNIRTMKTLRERLHYNSNIIYSKSPSKSSKK